MKKVVKRLLLLVAIALVVVLGVALTGVWLIRAAPAFYRPIALTPEQREAAAQSATNKFATMQNQAARMQAGNRAARRNSTQAPSTAGSNSITVSFTADEINSFFEKWSNFQNWKSSYERFLIDPIVILQNGRLIFAGRMKELNLVASLHFEPRIDERGQLRLDLVRILGGRLPLPEAVISKWENRVTTSLQNRLPVWQRDAAIDSGGAANSSAIAASAATMLFHILRHEPAEPVLFLPVLAQKGSVPVRISGVLIEEGKLTLTVESMNRVEQAGLIERIRGGSSGIADVNAVK